MSFRDRFQRFMMGRYGMDEFGRFLNIVSLVLLVASMVVTFFSRTASLVTSTLAILVIAYTYFRIFSRNYASRERENRWFCDLRYRRQGGYRSRPYGGYGNPYTNGYAYTQDTLTNEQKKRLDRKTHRIFKCPNCAQKIRVPKNRGKICIKCPKCRIEFIRKT